MKYVLFAAMLAVAFAGHAQPMTDTPPKKAEEPKAAVKKPAPKKPAAKKPPPKPGKPTPPTAGKVYMNDPKAPVLRDKQGNAIPTSPDAYDVSSATGKK